MAKQFALLAGLVAIAGIYFHEEVASFAGGLVGIESAEYGYGAGGTTGAAGGLGQSLDGSFTSVGGALR
ncbi:MAG: hypothetical protein GY791_02075 [Alphaproteobacteria bacterium]|nr:hypothetical protein [Alphaproteobacteria bacterium]